MGAWVLRVLPSWARTRQYGVGFLIHKDNRDSRVVRVERQLGCGRGSRELACMVYGGDRYQEQLVRTSMSSIG